MKISILSMQRVNNYGSVLQAYALKKIVESMDNEVEFIDIKTNNEEKQLLDGFYQSYANEYIINKGLLDKLKNKDEKNILRGFIKSLGKKYQKYLVNKFCRDELNLNENKFSSYDCCIIGSDEVFNCLQKSDWGYTSQLFGNVDNANKIITYAASCGTATVSETPIKVRESIKQAMQNIISISVRDSGTEQFVKKIVNKEVVTHLDPVAIGDFDAEISKCKKSFPKKFCIVYSYDNRINDTNVIAEIRRICTKENMELVSIFGTQKWISKHLILEPFAVLKAFKNAEMIITDTFHGTLFAAKYGKRVGVIIRESNRNKLTDLVKKLNIESYLINNFNDIEEVMAKKLNRENIDKLLEQERKRTMEYFQYNLKN